MKNIHLLLNKINSKHMYKSYAMGRAVTSIVVRGGPLTAGTLVLEIELGNNNPDVRAAIEDLGNYLIDPENHLGASIRKKLIGDGAESSAQAILKEARLALDSRLLTECATSSLFKELMAMINERWYEALIETASNCASNEWLNLEEPPQEILAKLCNAVANEALEAKENAWRDVILNALSRSDPDMDKLSPIEALDKLTKKIQKAGEEKKSVVVWPKSRDVGRIGDMSPTAHLRVGLDSDNDVYMSIWDDAGGGCIEFCTSSGGGGKSPKTRLALLQLMCAMEADNEKTPALDWWKLRESGAPPVNTEVPEGNPWEIAVSKFAKLLETPLTGEDPEKAIFNIIDKAERRAKDAWERSFHFAIHNVRVGRKSGERDLVADALEARIRRLYDEAKQQGRSEGNNRANY